jgi:formyltetrahydrofolate deformylase
MSDAASADTRILLIECDDRPGLVHLATGVLYRAGVNVIRNHEFVDLESRRFFMRTEFETAAAASSGSADLVAEVAKVLPPGARVEVRTTAPKRIVVLASREHHCLADLLVRHAYRELRATILAVVSNHDGLRSLAERFGVPFHHVPAVEGMSREAHEKAVEAVLEPLEPDLLVLAKYMRVLTPGFVQRWPRRILNIHHSFLPAFVGARPYHQAFARGVKVIGATAHYVTEERPIVVQQVIPVDHTHTAQDLAQSGRDVEQMVLARALKLVLEDRVFLNGHRTVIFD